MATAREPSTTKENELQPHQPTEGADSEASNTQPGTTCREGRHKGAGSYGEEAEALAVPDTPADLAQHIRHS